MTATWPMPWSFQIDGMPSPKASGGACAILCGYFGGKLRAGNAASSNFLSNVLQSFFERYVAVSG
jgi:hypothetical protein